MDKRGDEQFKRMLQEKEREALQPIKEDLAIWLSALLDVNIEADTFMDDLKSAVHLCRLAKLIQQASAARMSPMAPRVPQEKIHIDLPAANAPNMFHHAMAMSNAAKFISWCKNVEGVHIIFESEGLVKQKDERSVILCLLDLARVAAKVGMESPELVKMEREIEADEKEADVNEATEEHKSDASSHEEVVKEQKNDSSSHEEVVKEQKNDSSSHEEVVKEQKNDSSSHEEAAEEQKRVASSHVLDEKVIAKYYDQTSS